MSLKVEVEVVLGVVVSCVEGEGSGLICLVGGLGGGVVYLVWVGGEGLRLDCVDEKFLICDAGDRACGEGRGGGEQTRVVDYLSCEGCGQLGGRGQGGGGEEGGGWEEVGGGKLVGGRGKVGVRGHVSGVV